MAMAVDGNQVIPRVASGGIFEKQDFYKTYSKMGVILWQDFHSAHESHLRHEKLLDTKKGGAVEIVKFVYTSKPSSCCNLIRRQ